MAAFSNLPTAGRLDLSAWRNDDAFEVPIAFVGVDLTDLALAMQIRLGRDVPGAPLVDLGKVRNGQGLRVAGVTTASGMPTTDLRVRINKATMQALPYAGEIGSPMSLEYALLIAGRTRLVGGFEILAHAYGSDAAPSARPAGYGQPVFAAGGASSSGATVTISADGGVTVALTGAELLGPMVASAAANADQARASEVVARDGAATASAAAVSAGTSLASVRDALGQLPTGARLPYQATSRAALAGFTGQTAGQQAYLTEGRRSGVFVWTPGDQSASVAIDPLQGCAVAPAVTPSGAAGAWLRVDRSVIYPEWCGALGDSNGTQGSGTDDKAAIDAAIALVSAKGGELRFGPRIYRTTAARHRIAASGVSVTGNKAGALFFDTDDLVTPGRLLFDGYTVANGKLVQGYISNSGCSGLRVFNRAGVNVPTGTPATDPLGDGDPWIASACLVTFRGVRRGFFPDCELWNSPNWTVQLYDCFDFPPAIGTYIHDAIADGVHLAYGSSRNVLDGMRIENVGDDGIAIGATQGPPLRGNVVGASNILRGIGAAGVAVYGPVDGLVINESLIDSTWLAGIKLTAAAIGSSAKPVQFTPSSITNVTITPHIVGAGMRDASLFNRGDDVAAGIILDAFGAGGLIDGVQVTGGSIRKVRNNYVAEKQTAGKVGAVTVAGTKMEVISVAGGAGASAAGEGYSRNPIDLDVHTYSAVKMLTATRLLVRGGSVDGAPHHAVYAGPGTGMADVDGLMVYASNASPVGAVVELRGAAGLATRVHAAALPAGVSVANVVNQVQVALISSVDAPETLLFSDAFNRADAATLGAGYTLSSGATAAIVGGRAVLGGNVPTATRDVGLSTVLDVAATIYPSGGHSRLYARVDGAMHIAIDTAGVLYYFDGANVRTIVNFAAVATNGSHRLRLVVRGQTVIGYVDGTMIGQGSPKDGAGNVINMPMAAATAGFGEPGPGGKVAFDDFSVSTFPA